eukprot:768301-Pleurochrysis_carterae.AAC.5
MPVGDTNQQKHIRRAAIAHLGQVLQNKHKDSEDQIRSRTEGSMSKVDEVYPTPATMEPVTFDCHLRAPSSDFTVSRALRR